MSEPRIKTRCPSCGHDTLFVPEHGLLTCSWIGCNQPAAINDTVAEIDRLVKENTQLRQDRYDALSVTSKDGLLSSEWVARTGAAERKVREKDAEIARLKADAAKDAEMIAELASDLEDAEVASWRNETKGREAMERRGLCKVNGRWERVK